MRKLGVTVMIGVLAATIGMVAAPAGAGSSSRFCDSVDSIYDGSNADDTEDGGQDDLSELADDFRRTARQAPRPVKKAMKKMAKYYDLIGGIDGSDVLEDAGDAAVQRTVTGFVTASATFYEYVAEECSGLDVTVPTDVPELG